MIWNPEQVGPAGADDAAIGDIVAELQGLCGGAMGAATDNLYDVAAAVEQALEDGSQEKGLGPQALIGLASQALLSIGETKAARRLSLLGAGVVRPAAWEVTGEETVWVVDLAPLALSRDCQLEMQLFGSLDAILECMADVWDESDGHGILGLMHLQATQSGMGRRAVCGMDELAAEIRTACVLRLGAIAERRGWSERPEVMTLELRG